MALIQFDVRGEQVSDDETEEIIRKGDPHRGLIRYRPDGSELFVHARINIALLRGGGFAADPASQARLTRRRVDAER